MKKKIVIDAGHGGKDPGAVFEDVKEKDLNLSIAKKLRNMLYKAGYEVSMTRIDDTFIKLSDRARLANELEVDIFVSIHNNAASNINVEGIETLYYPGSEEGKKLATNIQLSMIKKAMRKDRGLKERDNLYVLKYTHMPAVLVEGGFITHYLDRHLLKEKEYRYLLAEAIYDGIENYFNR